MKSLVFFCLVSFITSCCMCQSYVDVFQLRYTYAFKSGQLKNRATPFTHVWAGSDLPIKLKNNAYLVFSPYYEYWQLDSASTKKLFPAVQGVVLPVSLLLPLNGNRWKLILTAMGRSNGEHLFAGNTYQLGGVAIVSYEKAAGKRIKAGLYVNGEYFGVFIMPLIGADWRINENNYLFGMLPGRFTWEHRFSPYLYAGITFRALTNSYRLQNEKYLRIDDNQLSAFLDVYPAKRVCLTLEPGYGIYRKLRTGTGKRQYYAASNWGDGFFIKLSAAFRVRQ